MRCPVCDVDDTMERAVLECSASGQEIIWKLCPQLWEMKYPKMPTLSIGLDVDSQNSKIQDTKTMQKPTDYSK
jgi:hypothetical protein